MGLPPRGEVADDRLHHRPRPGQARRPERRVPARERCTGGRGRLRGVRTRSHRPEDRCSGGQPSWPWPRTRWSRGCRSRCWVPAGLARPGLAAEPVARTARTSGVGRSRRPSPADQEADGRIVRAIGGRGPVDRVLAGIGPTLLVLDAFAGSGSRVAQWVGAAPDLSVVLTARERPEVPEERVVALSSLPPHDAADLFRAAAARAGCRFSPDDPGRTPRWSARRRPAGAGARRRPGAAGEASAVGLARTGASSERSWSRRLAGCRPTFDERWPR